jgi:hypothetical protein
MLIILIILIKFIIFICIITQAHADLGFADHVWQDKRAAIAQTFDVLGNQFRPAVHNTLLEGAVLSKCASKPISNEFEKCVGEVHMSNF